MSVRLSWFAVLSLALLGCGPNFRERGRFAAVTAAGLPASVERVSTTPVEGEACFGLSSMFGDDHVVDAAVKDALAKVPGADAIAFATITDDGSCITVRGMAVRVGTARQATR